MGLLSGSSSIMMRSFFFWCGSIRCTFFIMYFVFILRRCLSGGCFVIRSSLIRVILVRCCMEMSILVR